MGKPSSLEAKRDAVSKALKSLTSEDLVVSKISLGEEAEGYRWELYRGVIPFWVDLMRFARTVDLLVVYSIMFGIPDGLDDGRENELYRLLLELNDFSQSWDTKFFIKGRSVVLCASRSGEEISSGTARFLVDSFSRFAKVLSKRIADRFPEIARFVVKGDMSEINGKETESGQ